jgi:hypothetical protein
MTTAASRLARLVWQFGEPVHALTYFVPETRSATDALGLRGGWMSYFGCRAAPLGPVAPAVVSALFYNFHPEMVQRALPDAWTLASPPQLLDARLEAMDEALRRILGDVVDSTGVRRTAELAREAVERCDITGRPLGAANAAMSLSRADHLSLWQSLTTLREYRGDGHVAALVGAGVSPAEALVLQAATGRSDPEVLRVNRGWTEEAWDRAAEDLRGRGWVDAAGAVTDAGRDARDRLEAATDRLAAPLVDGIGTEAAEELVALLRPLAEAAMASGSVPPLNNMGLPWPPTAD